MGIARFSFLAGNEIYLCPMVCPMGRNQTELLVLNYARGMQKECEIIKDRQVAINFSARKMRVVGFR